jgi:hypothetical protein
MPVHEETTRRKPSYNVMLTAIAIVGVIGFAVLFLTFR